VATFTSAGKTSLAPGWRSTSSKVIAWRIFMGRASFLAS
jgi:hypothetical protein